MPLYSITLEEFLRLYGDVPEAKFMFDMPDDKKAKDGGDSGNDSEAADRKQIRDVLRSNRWRRKIKAVARKCHLWREQGGEEADVIKQSMEEGNENEENRNDKKKPNTASKAMRWLCQGMLRHFYFMSVATESTGGIYMTTYHPSFEGTVISSLDYCYVSSYACTTPRTTLVY